MACRMEAKKRSNVVVDGSSEQMVEQADTNLSSSVVVLWTSKRMSCSNVGWTEFHFLFFFLFFFFDGSGSCCAGRDGCCDGWSDGWMFSVWNMSMAA